MTAKGIQSIVIAKFTFQNGNGKPSLVGGSTGLVAGLVAITPGAGFVSLWSSLLIGLMVSPLCYFAIAVLKSKFGLPFKYFSSASHENIAAAAEI